MALKCWALAFLATIMINNGYGKKADFPKFCKTSVCGIESKIVGGTPTLIQNYPWQVGLHSKRGKRTSVYPFCGGSLIHENWILTAAHCVSGTSRKKIAIVLGATNVRANEPGKQRIDVAQIISHRSYNSRTLNYDYALIRLKKPARIDDFVAPISFFPSKSSYTTENCVITGWGTTSSGGSLSEDLRAATTTVITNEQCQQQYNGGITDNMVCAGDLVNGGVDTCQGDSGGPLACRASGDTTGPFYLRGITSWGYGCAEAEHPGVYADVPAAYEWIEQNTGLSFTTAG